MMGWIQTLGSIAAKVTWVDWAALVGGAGILLYWLGTRTFDHFKRRGLPFARPVPFFGNMAAVTFGRTSAFTFIDDLYRQFEGHQVVGFFQSLRPSLLIRDPELVKMVTVKEFDHFVDRQITVSEEVDPIFTRNLLTLKGQEWRDMRATLSPTFTASKMRTIFKLIDHCGEQLATFLENEIKASRDGLYEVEMKDFSTRFTNDVIATSAFGIECDSLKQPHNEFYRMGRNLTSRKGLRGLIFLGYFVFPKVMTMLRIPFVSPSAKDFFHNAVHDTINDRQKHGTFRPDMLQLMMQVQKGQLKAEAEDEQENIKGANMKKLTDSDLTAQALIFFFAGFDTVSTVLSFSAFELARQREIQERLQSEVDDVFERNGGRLVYEAVQELKYMEMFINEILRLHTTVPFLNRMCTKDFTIPAQGNVPAYTMRKGELIWVPVHPLHRDPKYWNDPEKFDPERFNEENKHKIVPYTYMPFGMGPRICIGTRFALMETKVALAHVLRHFRFKATSRTPKRKEYSPSDFGPAIKGGFWVGIEARAR